MTTRSLPKLLVTGFSPFPGVPINPTQALIGRLREHDWTAADFDRRFEVFDVDYRGLPTRLSEIARTFAPDVAVHFGLSQRAEGFQLERVGRNVYANARPDNAGFAPDDGPICAAAPLLPSRLPLQAIHDRLRQAGLPAGWSDDAGGYLCNQLMTLSLAGVCAPFAPFAPEISGFIHVPPVGQGTTMTADELFVGAMLIIELAMAEFARRSPQAEPAFA